MTSIISNTRASLTITQDIILGNIIEAKNKHIFSRDAASAAVAHAYLVWIDCFSSRAHKDSRAWLEAQISKRNEEIDRHNKEEKDLKERADQFVKGKLDSDNWLNSNPDSKSERDDIESEKVRLRALAALTKDQWAARRRVRVEARDGASQFTQLVKFVFDFDRAADASATSRYANVLDWVETKFCNETVEDVSQISEAIKAAGGFEAVLNQQRGTQPVDDTAAKDDKAIAEAIAKQAKDAVHKAAAKCTFEMAVNNAPEGIVMMLGRYVDGHVEIIGEMPLSNDKLDEVVSAFDDEKLLPTKDHAEFISRVMALGQLVEDGKVSDVKEDGTKAGRKEVEQRTLSMVPHNDAGLELVISARFADASAVIKACPRLGRVDLGSTTKHMIMPYLQSRALAKMLDARSVRRLVDVQAETVAGELSWLAGNSALLAIGSSNAQRRFTWADLSHESHVPMDIDGFKPQVGIDVEVSDLRALYCNRLKSWHESKDGKKHLKLMSLHFKGGQLTYQADGKADHSLPCSTTSSVTVFMQFRARDMHDLILQLSQQQVKAIKLSLDRSGLLCASWSDHLGDYAVYLPTATNDGRLEHRRVTPMQIEGDMTLAA